MPDLREQLRQLLQGRVCFIGVGNADFGDDGFGVRLAEELKSEGRRPKAERRPKVEGRGKDMVTTLDTLDDGPLASSRLTPSEQPKRAISQRPGGHASPADGEIVQPRSNPSDFGLRPSFGLRASDFGLRSHVVIAGASPERLVGGVADEAYDHVLFLDAVEFGGAPGSAVLLNSDKMATRFPQVSTHKLSLGLLARQIEANGRTKTWLLGVQPESLKPGKPLSRTVQTTLELLLELLRTYLNRSSRDDEALKSPTRQLDNREHLSLVTSAATKNTEVMA
jgi:hydrogenase maturation protease